jgi:hypothetical protein
MWVSLGEPVSLQGLWIRLTPGTPRAHLGHTLDIVYGYMEPDPPPVYIHTTITLAFPLAPTACPYAHVHSLGTFRTLLQS